MNAVDAGTRPDMATYASWSDGTTDRSRYAVDGGVLVNTPTKQALEAIDRMPAGGPVRRVMVLLFPHAEAPGVQPAAADPAVLPTTLGTGGSCWRRCAAKGPGPSSRRSRSTTGSRRRDAAAGRNCWTGWRPTGTRTPPWRRGCTTWSTRCTPTTRM
ncbi:hypothetical protein ACFQV2_20525 [Actinokineospora soli]|uniref:PNPLA domain-containing protein n=1 Tax=Actinokineospora soli TaxID=1048753 RepID=A0ABW2TQ94_9PSEU